MLIAKAKDAAFWARAATDEAYRPLVENLLAGWEADCRDDLPAAKFSEFRLYYDNGSRKEYEASYFKRRRAMNHSALLAMLYPEEEKYLVKLQDCIWAILDEFTWVLPAHTGPVTQPPIPIDLFCAETGFALSEIDYILGDRLHPAIRRRIREECERRIINTFLNRAFGWENDHHNWAAVCMGGVTATFLYLAPEKFPLIRSRLIHTMDCFLDSYSEDGICYEGFGYWIYGLGFFLYAADLVKDFTEGRINLLTDPRVKRTATYPQRVMVANGAVASFADGGGNGDISLAMAHYLRGLFPDVMKIPAIKYTQLKDGCGRWALHLRSFIWYNPEAEVTDMDSSHEYWSESSQVLIKRTGIYGFAAKGGSNAELHNHNDIGSFLVTVDGKQLLCDPGAGVYSAQYFNAKLRYEDFCASSRGHSLPIIDGAYQSVGGAHRAKADYADGRLTLDLSAGYVVNSAILPEGSFVREFEIEDARLVMVDRYAPGHTVVERLIAGAEPVIEGDVIRIGRLSLKASGFEGSVKITPAPKNGFWCLDFEGVGARFEMEAVII